MAHRPKPTTATARTQWNKEHARTLSKEASDRKYHNKNAQSTYNEIKSGKYTTGGQHLFGMKPVAGGYFTSEDPTTEELPSQEVEGPFGEIKKAASNIRWILENKSVSDQEEKMLENLLLGVESHIELELDRDQTFHNQADANKMDAGEFFSTGTKGNISEKIAEEPTAGGKVQKVIEGGETLKEGPPPLPPITDIEPQYSADPNDKNFKGILSSLEAEGEIDLAAQAKRRKLFEKNRIKDEDRYG